MMSSIKIFIGLSIIFFSINSPAAVEIVECEDEEGNKTYQKICPPGAIQLNKKRVPTGREEAAENKPVNSESTAFSISATMYSIPDCSPCDAVREFMKIKNITLNEINVEGDIERQAELAKLNGSLNVPITLIGDKKLSGYSRTELLAALKEAGWKDPNANKTTKEKKAEQSEKNK